MSQFRRSRRQPKRKVWRRVSRHICNDVLDLILEYAASDSPSSPVLLVDASTAWTASFQTPLGYRDWVRALLVPGCESVVVATAPPWTLLYCVEEARLYFCRDDGPRLSVYGAMRTHLDWLASRKFARARGSVEMRKDLRIIRRYARRQGEIRALKKARPLLALYAAVGDADARDLTTDENDAMHRYEDIERFRVANRPTFCERCGRHKSDTFFCDHCWRW